MTKLIDKILSKMGIQIKTKGSEIDLVCGMKISEKSKLSATYKGKTYYFCSDHCQKHFKDNPEKYIRE